LNAAGRVACISTATRRDVLRLSSLAPSQVSLVYNGLNHAYAPLSSKEAAARISQLATRLGKDTAEKLQNGFILHVGGNHWYKNRLGLIQIYSLLCKQMSHPPSLVLAGQPFTPQLRSSITSQNLQDRVIELSSMSSEDLRTLYCAAELLLFPSFVEGFGWPIIEAQACGCRVVIPDREPMTEIGGEAAVCFKLENVPAREGAPMSDDSAADGANAVMKTLLESPKERHDRVQNSLRNAARFTTAQMVESYVQLYERILVGGTRQQLRSQESVLEVP
jgi:glycosyltransferase involved in cell wall biosynthesis